MTHATGSRATGKVKKPRKDFPLFPHASGRWAKKVRGSFAYFGKVSDDTSGEKALALWLEQKDELLAGRKPTKDREGKITIEQLGFAFCDKNDLRRQAGAISNRTFSEYRATCKRLAEILGRSTPVTSLTSEDFDNLRAKLAKGRGPVTLWNEIVRIKTLFNYGLKSNKLSKLPSYGDAMDKPDPREFRKAENARGEKGFTPEELRLILTSTSNVALNAACWLAANCGYGQTDIASIPLSAVDLKAGWATFPRPKTGTKRRAKLWPETVDAIRKYLAIRPIPRDEADADLMFLNSRGRRLVRQNDGDDPTLWQSRTDVLGKVFAHLLKSLKIGGRRGFYGIRHSFQTGAEESRDLPAVMHCMGHTDASMSGRYRMEINDKRLEGVADAVHAWLFGAPQNGGPKS